MSWKEIIIVSLIIALFAFGVVSMLQGVVKEKQLNTITEQVDSTILLKKDSSGCKVFLLKYNGKEFLVNNQGGILEITE